MLTQSPSPVDTRASLINVKRNVNPKVIPKINSPGAVLPRLRRCATINVEDGSYCSNFSTACATVISPAIF